MGRRPTGQSLKRSGGLSMIKQGLFGTDAVHSILAVAISLWIYFQAFNLL